MRASSPVIPRSRATSRSCTLIQVGLEMLEEGVSEMYSAFVRLLFGAVWCRTRALTAQCCYYRDLLADMDSRGSWRC